MSRESIPFQVDDISRLSRFIRKKLLEIKGVPSHLELMNILAKASGNKNYQELKAQRSSLQVEAVPKINNEPEDPVIKKRVQRFIRHLDEEKCLIRWPKKRAEQILALWLIWEKLPSNVQMTEKEINDHINLWHRFGDYALIRRELCDLGILSRKPDGSAYHRASKQEPNEISYVKQLIEERT